MNRKLSLSSPRSLGLTPNLPRQLPVEVPWSGTLGSWSPVRGRRGYVRDAPLKKRTRRCWTRWSAARGGQFRLPNPRQKRYLDVWGARLRIGVSPNATVSCVPGPEPAISLKTEQPRAGAVGQPGREAVRFLPNATLCEGYVRGRTLRA